MVFLKVVVPIGFGCLYWIWVSVDIIDTTISFWKKAVIHVGKSLEKYV